MEVNESSRLINIKDLKIKVNNLKLEIKQLKKNKVILTKDF